MEAETLHLFDAYTRGNLSEAEKGSFETRLTTDADFKAEFEEYIHMVNGIEAYERERIREMLRESQNRFLGSNVSWRSFRAVAAAAAVILILVIPGYVIFRMTTLSSRLANEYYMADPGLPVKMGASTHSLLDQAMIEYKDKKYQDALDKISILKASEGNNDTLDYYAGICHFELGETDLAIESFKLVSDPASAFYFESLYNLGISYLKKGDNAQAKTVLQTVAHGEGGTLGAKAAELLKKI